MKINKRIYTNYFSQHVIPSIVAVLLFALSYTQLAELHVQHTVNQNLVFTLRYLGLLSAVIGFRGNIPALKAIHKTAAVLLGIIPTLYVLLSIGLVFIVSLFGAIITILSGEIDKNLLYGIFEALPFVFIYTMAAVSVWLLVIRIVFKQYKYPYDLDTQSKLASVTALLMLFGPLGVHRFFVGRIASGIIFLTTFGFLGLGVVYDGLMLTLGRFTDGEGNTI